MVSKSDLELKTKEFFDKFWCLENDPPIWSDPWQFKGELRHNQSKGCYAHLLGDEVTYIGLGIGKSYGGSGLGSRISNYWKYSGEIEDGNRIYEPTVKYVDSIITLPFGENDFYLASALEIYLIQNLNLKKNKVHSK